MTDVNDELLDFLSLTLQRVFSAFSQDFDFAFGL